MKPLRRFLTLAAAGVAGALLVDAALAQTPGRPKSTLTITERTEVPGTVLEPGTYVIKVVDNQSSWNVVSIQDASEQKTFATLLATPHTAKEQPPNTVFVYFETPEGQPRVLRSWWPPDDRWGQDFVYSSAKREELARYAKEPIPEMTAEMEQSFSTRSETQVATTTTTETQPDIGSTWRTERMDTTTTDVETERETQVAQDTRRDELPRTASPYGLLALLGAGALGAGFATRRFLA